MKGLLLLGVAFLLFFSMLPGLEENQGNHVISSEIQENGHQEKLNAVSLPCDSPVVIPEFQVALAEPNKSDQEKKIKSSFFKASGIHLIRNQYHLNPHKRKNSTGFHTLRFILFRNLRL